MTTFEFISVLLSIVVGLALTRLLSGLSRVVELQMRVTFSWPQGAWAVNVGLALVVFWWATLGGQMDLNVWSFPSFALLLLYAVLLYVLAALIVPTELVEGADLGAHFAAVRPWFFAVAALTALAELGDTLLRGGFERVRAFGPLYSTLIVMCVVLGGTGAFIKNRRFQQLLPVVFFGFMMAWVFSQFWTLG
jgi:hypothetical protein